MKFERIVVPVFCVLQQVVDAVLSIQRPNEPLDLHMVEIQEMQHKTDMDTEWVASSTVHYNLSSFTDLRGRLKRRTWTQSV